MNELRVFQHGEFGELGLLELDGKTYFPATRCASVLGYSNPREAIRAHCKGVREILTPSKGGNQATNFIPEGDLYRLIARSKLPGAERFERWVFDEVLPSIRRHGGYLTPARLEEALADPDTLIRLATDLKEERRRRLEAESEKAAIAEENEALEAALNESLKYCTVAKYNKERAMGWDMARCKEIGKAMSAYCRARAIEVKKCETNDERFGSVNSYPMQAWEGFMRVMELGA